MKSDSDDNKVTTPTEREVILPQHDSSNKESFQREVTLPQQVIEQFGLCAGCEWYGSYRCPENFSSKGFVPSKDVHDGSIQGCDHRLKFLKSISSKDKPTYKQFVKDYHQYLLLIVTNKDYRLMDDLETKLRERTVILDGMHGSKSFDRDEDKITELKVEVKDLVRQLDKARERWMTSVMNGLKYLEEDVKRETPKTVNINQTNILTLSDIDRVMRLQRQNREKLVLDGTIIGSNSDN